MEPKHFAQQITFLYAEDPADSWDFYENKLGLSLVQDQGTCRIYATAPGDRAFLGICRARAPRASDNPRVKVPEQVEYSEAYRVTHFFFHDPAGYLLEVQRFERPDWPAPG